MSSAVNWGAVQQQQYAMVSPQGVSFSFFNTDKPLIYSVRSHCLIIILFSLRDLLTMQGIFFF